MTLIRKRRSAPHARGLQKRRRMLDAARGLLARRAVDDITLSDVARAAGVASSSAYHFYADIDELLVSLQAEVQRELVGVLQRPLRASLRPTP